MCTVFKHQAFTDSSFIIGKNYDTPDPCYGMIFTNQRNLSKTALIRNPEIPKQWKSTYGSIVFSQVGKEFPSCGMNEAGLVVEQTTLWNTTYPDRDHRPALKELQWIQYMLDTTATVDEVINSLQGLRIAQADAGIQYFVCDGNGDLALIEYILGKEVVFRKNELPYPVIANDMYQTSVDYLHIHRGYGGTKEFKSSPFSIDRFVFIANELNSRIEPGRIDNEVEIGFSILQQAEFEETPWQLVYQPQEKMIWYKSKNSPQLKSLHLGQFNFSETGQSLVKDIESNQSDEFAFYSTEKNYRLAKSFFSTNRLVKAAKYSEELIREFAKYPETLNNL
ncbi:MAG TPA: linear amide C-N hydrolase [Bacillota bacterium]|nr:linear amide C-N hydrolase [Bacillota bacterium]